MRKIFLYILIFFALSVVSIILAYSFSKKAKPDISITYTTAVQGYITAHEDVWLGLKKNPLAGGAAIFAAFVKKQRKMLKGKNTAFLVLDTGNFFQGTQEGNLFKGGSVIEIMNQIGYDAMALGELDLVFGEDNLKKLSMNANFPFLCANVIEKKTAKLPSYLKPYLIKEYNGIKIAVIGVINPLTVKDIIFKGSDGLKFLDPIYALNNCIHILKKQGVKIIIVLSNLGLENDKKLAQVAQGIDIIIGGNLNEKDVWRPEYIDTANNTVVIETWDRQMAAYRLDLILDKRGNVVKHRNYFFDLYAKFFKPDPSIEKIIHKYNREIRQIKKRVVGYAESELLRCVDSESTLGDWIADIIRKKTAADMAFCAGMQGDLKKGPVKVSDIYNIFPILDIPNIKNFNVAVLELSREEIIEMLEHSVGWVLDNNENGKRSILQLSGLKMVYDPNALIKHRIKEVSINAKPLEKYKIYRVAVCDYLSSGTDRYYEIKFAAKIKNTGLFSFDILMDELKQNPHIFKRDIEGRIIKLEN